MDETKTLTLGSLFDGSAGFPLAGMLAGIIPVWASEVEPFPIRVTTKRIPQMKHYGDVSVLKGGELPPVDIITFGSPCQDMSVAGKRAGLDGERSGLFHQAIRIIKEMREKTNGAYPRYIVWENVPGAFSSNGGEDFKAVLEEICRVRDAGAAVPVPEGGKWSKAGEIVGDGYSLAWRVLDAQYWGVPQRRARIFLVADFAGEGAGDLLFVPEGLCGNTREGWEAWQGTARDPEGSTGEAGRWCINPQGSSGISVTEEQTGTLVSQDHGHHPAVLQAAGFCTEHSANARSIGYEEEVAPTLRAGVVPAAVYDNHAQDCRYNGPLEVAPTVVSRYGTGGNNQPIVVEPEGPLIPQTLKIRCGKAGGGKGALVQENLSATLSTHNDQTLFAPAEQTAFGISSDQSHAMLSDNPHAGIYEAKTSRTLDQGCNNPGCNQGGVAVVEKVYPGGDGRNDQAGAYAATVGSFMQVSEEKAQTLMARDWKDPQVVAREPYYIVRRLTPTECARLQGFPDWWMDGLGEENPSDEEVAFWMDVFETHRKVITKAGKPKTEKQVRKWLADPYRDASAYAMWGNGVALPCVWFVLSSIVHHARKTG